MYQVTINFNIPGELTYKNEVVNIPSPKYYIGQTVYQPEDEIHPLDLRPLQIISQTLRYVLEEGSQTDLFICPSWCYGLKNPKTNKMREYQCTESSLISHEEQLKTLQDAIDGDSLMSHQQFELFYSYGLNIPEKTIMKLWYFLKGSNISYPASDFRKTAEIYLSCGKQMDDYV